MEPCAKQQRFNADDCRALTIGTGYRNDFGSRLSEAKPLHHVLGATQTHVNGLLMLLSDVLKPGI